MGLYISMGGHDIRDISKRCNYSYIYPWWRHQMQVFFQRYWPFVREIHRSPGISSDKGQWRGDLMFSLVCPWINGWVNDREAGDFRRHRTHYEITLMVYPVTSSLIGTWTVGAWKIRFADCARLMCWLHGHVGWARHGRTISLTVQLDTLIYTNDVLSQVNRQE